MVLMDRNQPYDAAMKVPCGLALELVQSRLDEGLASLGDEKSRLARKSVLVRLEFGSVKNMVAEVKQRAPIKRATL